MDMTAPLEVTVAKPVQIEQRMSTRSVFPMPGLMRFLDELQNVSGTFSEEMHHTMANRFRTAIQFKLLTARFGLHIPTETDGVFKMYDSLAVNSLPKERALITAETEAILHPDMQFSVFGDGQGLYCMVLEARPEGQEPRFATVTISDRPGEAPTVLAEAQGKLVRARRNRLPTVLPPELIAKQALAKAGKKVS